MAEDIHELQSEIIRLKKELEQSNKQRSVYENGDAKLYYALQRKMTEMANTLNKQNLETVDIEDKNSKTFDRIISILQKCETISSSASALGAIAGITGNEENDINKKPFLDTLAVKRD